MYVVVTCNCHNLYSYAFSWIRCRNQIRVNVKLFVMAHLILIWSLQLYRDWKGRHKVHLINKSLERVVPQNLIAGRPCERVHLYSTGHMVVLSPQFLFAGWLCGERRNGWNQTFLFQNGVTISLVTFSPENNIGFGTWWQLVRIPDSLVQC